MINVAHPGSIEVQDSKHRVLTVTFPFVGLLKCESCQDDPQCTPGTKTITVGMFCPLHAFAQTSKSDAVSLPCDITPRGKGLSWLAFSITDECFPKSRLLMFGRYSLNLTPFLNQDS